jgi:hypothetical protein
LSPNQRPQRHRAVRVFCIIFHAVCFLINVVPYTDPATKPSNAKAAVVTPAPPKPPAWGRAADESDIDIDDTDESGSDEGLDSDKATTPEPATKPKKQQPPVVAAVTPEPAKPATKPKKQQAPVAAAAAAAVTPVHTPKPQPAHRPSNESDSDSDHKKAASPLVEAQKKKTVAPPAKKTAVADSSDDDSDEGPSFSIASDGLFRSHSPIRFLLLC